MYVKYIAHVGSEMQVSCYYGLQCYILILFVTINTVKKYIVYNGEIE